MPPRLSAAPLALTADPDAAGLEALFEKVAAEFSAPLTRLARAHEVDAELDEGQAIQKINALIQALKPLDR